jgi:hypothetical protein
MSVEYLGILGVTLATGFLFLGRGFLSAVGLRGPIAEGRGGGGSLSLSVLN